LPEVKKRAPGRSAVVVELPVTVCDPLDQIRVRDVGGSVGGGQHRGACPGSPPFSLYRRVTGAHQPLNGWGSPIRSGSGRWAIQGRNGSFCMAVGPCRKRSNLTQPGHGGNIDDEHDHPNNQAATKHEEVTHTTMTDHHIYYTCDYVPFGIWEYAISNISDCYLIFLNSVTQCVLKFLNQLTRTLK